MSEALLMLRLEHRNTARLLDCLENLAERTLTGSAMDYAMLAKAMVYFQTFPDQQHHPKEELIYAALERRHPDVTEAIGDLTLEHLRLAELTSRLTDLVNSERLEGGDGRRLVQPLKEFISRYREHMQREEKDFFSAADRLLSRLDWGEIEFRIFDSDDPLFHHSNETEFADLRREIAKMDADDRHAADAAREQQALSRVTDLRQFNSARRDQGDSLRLIPFVKGGYGIERDGDLLAHLPPCSESRAAWCAHMFAAGEESARRQTP